MSHTSFQAGQIRLFNGKALVIVRAGTRSGVSTLTASADGLAPSSVRIEVRQESQR